jgi:hypothetical protein
MNNAPSESGIVRAVAEAAARRIARNVIAELQQMAETLAGDDSGLKTVWDAICVQVQYEQSFYWDAYDNTARAIMARHLDGLEKYERDAIWLQSRAGVDWSCKEPEDREADPVLKDDIVDYITNDHVYEEAGRWSNDRIRAYLDRGD